ncbi:MAG: hypothetical protein JO161_08050 [Planctomycetaceae bacterium]|nr:hypothetical protein [Planctomycetaceae bacterium]
MSTLAKLLEGRLKPRQLRLRRPVLGTGPDWLEEALPIEGRDDRADSAGVMVVGDELFE